MLRMKTHINRLVISKHEKQDKPELVVSLNMKNKDVTTPELYQPVHYQEDFTSSTREI